MHFIIFIPGTIVARKYTSWFLKFYLFSLSRLILWLFYNVKCNVFINSSKEAYKILGILLFYESIVILLIHRFLLLLTYYFFN